jgi:DsbC/DsbD-like thiol-disulfide interchange protein
MPSSISSSSMSSSSMSHASPIQTRFERSLARPLLARIRGLLVRLSLLALSTIGCSMVAFEEVCAAEQGVPSLSRPLDQGAGKPPAKEPKTGEELVAVEVAVVGEAKAGATVQLAVTYTVHPGWHIYWRSAGESGSPTLIGLELPEGCVAARDASGELAVAFPAPQVFSKGETTFGYEGSVTLSVPVTLPSGFTQGSALPATVRTSWLVCKELCLLGRKEAKVDLAAPSAPDSVAAARLSEALAGVPTPLPAGWKVSLRSIEEDTATLVVEIPADAAKAGFRFIPYDTPGCVLESGYMAETKGRALEVELRLSRGSSLGKPIEVAGILVSAETGVAARKPSFAHAFTLAIPAAE